MSEMTAGASDLDAMKAMLARAGIVFQEEPMEEGPWAIRLVVYQGEGKHNLGYKDCSANFYFDAEGRLIGMGAWS